MRWCVGRIQEEKSQVERRIIECSEHHGRKLVANDKEVVSDDRRHTGVFEIATRPSPM